MCVCVALRTPLNLLLPSRDITGGTKQIFSQLKAMVLFSLKKKCFHEFGPWFYTHYTFATGTGAFLPLLNTVTLNAEWLVPSYALPNNKKSVALKRQDKCCLKRLSCFMSCKCFLQTSMEGILWQSLFHPCTERPSHHWPPGVKTVCYFQGQCYTDQCESEEKLYNTEKHTFKALISFKGFKCRQVFLFLSFFSPFMLQTLQEHIKGISSHHMLYSFII